jgi:hypothetical protein
MAMLFRDAELRGQFHAFGFHLHSDLLQEVESLIGKGVSPPGHVCVDVGSTLHIGHIESNLSELVDFVWRKAR